MRKLALIALLVLITSPAWAQGSANPVPAAPVSPFLALGNILRNPEAPPPPPPGQGTSQPLPLPTAIPPNTIGTGR